MVEPVAKTAPAPVYAEAIVLVTIYHEGMTATNRVECSIEHRTVGINLSAQLFVPFLCAPSFY